MLKHVDIYITHTIKCMLADSAKYGYVLAYQKQDGEWKELIGCNSINKRVTMNSIVLTAMEEALKRLKEAVELNIYIDSPFIVNMFKSKAVDRWLSNGFLNAKGDKIVDFTKWESVLSLCERHMITVEYVQTHRYTDRLEDEMKKA